MQPCSLAQPASQSSLRPCSLQPCSFEACTLAATCSPHACSLQACSTTLPVPTPPSPSAGHMHASAAARPPESGSALGGIGRRPGNYKGNKMHNKGLGSKRFPATSPEGCLGLVHDVGFGVTFLIILYPYPPPHPLPLLPYPLQQVDCEVPCCCLAQRSFGVYVGPALCWTPARKFKVPRWARATLPHPKISPRVTSAPYVSAQIPEPP
jgi:hypothetical protein